MGPNLALLTGATVKKAVHLGLPMDQAFFCEKCTIFDGLAQIF